MPGWLCSRSMLGVSWKTRSDPWDNSQQLVGVMQKPTVQTPISSILGDKLINPIGMGLYTHYKDYLLPVDDHHQYKVLIDSTYGWRAWARHISLKIGFFWRDFGCCYEKSIMSSGLLASKQIWNPRMVWIGRWFPFQTFDFACSMLVFRGCFSMSSCSQRLPMFCFHCSEDVHQTRHLPPIWGSQRCHLCHPWCFPAISPTPKKNPPGTGHGASFTFGRGFGIVGTSSCMVKDVKELWRMWN